MMLVILLVLVGKVTTFSGTVTIFGMKRKKCNYWGATNFFTTFAGR